MFNCSAGFFIEISIVHIVFFSILNTNNMYKIITTIVFHWLHFTMIKFEVMFVCYEIWHWHNTPQVCCSFDITRLGVIAMAFRAHLWYLNPPKLSLGQYSKIMIQYLLLRYSRIKIIHRRAHVSALQMKCALFFKLCLGTIVA